MPLATLTKLFDAARSYQFLEIARASPFFSTALDVVVIHVDQKERKTFQFLSSFFILTGKTCLWLSAYFLALE